MDEDLRAHLRRAEESDAADQWVIYANARKRAEGLEQAITGLVTLAGEHAKSFFIKANPANPKDTRVILVSRPEYGKLLEDYTTHLELAPGTMGINQQNIFYHAEGVFQAGKEIHNGHRHHFVHEGKIHHDQLPQPFLNALRYNHSRDRVFEPLLPEDYVEQYNSIGLHIGHLTDEHKKAYAACRAKMRHIGLGLRSLVQEALPESRLTAKPFCIHDPKYTPVASYNGHQGKLKYHAFETTTSTTNIWNGTNIVPCIRKYIAHVVTPEGKLAERQSKELLQPAGEPLTGEFYLPLADEFIAQIKKKPRTRKPKETP